MSAIACLRQLTGTTSDLGVMFFGKRTRWALSLVCC